MSSLLNKIENVAHPERREYHDAAAQRHVAGADPSVPRTGHAAHSGVGSATAGTHAIGSEYTTTGHPHAHEHINSTNGKHGYIQYGRSPASGPAPTTAGPHRHDFMNKLDPRVDSTADKRPVVANTNAHHSKIANVLDPRVDSKIANNPNVATTGTVSTNAGYPEDSMGYPPNAGRHGTHGAQATTAAGYPDGSMGYPPNAGRHGTHGAQATTAAGMGTGAHVNPTMHGGAGHTLRHTGPGPANKTAGPHRSNLLNKLDPSVDSRTGATTTTSGTYPAGTNQY